MALRLVQLRDTNNKRRVAAVDEGPARLVEDVETTFELAHFALEERATLAEAVRRKKLGGVVDLEAALAAGRVLAPIDHPDPAHMLLTGTGLTHLGSAESRDRMHAAAAAGSTTDSMRMFLMGLEGGKPAKGGPGVQPEWFYKGTGEAVVGAGQTLQAPDFALDAGEEPEIAGIYVIASDGTPVRLGYCLANEFSDHVTEQENYLWLAHSKLRQAALGPELLAGPLPDHVNGVSRILRAGEELWARPFSSGEANMSHALANLEHHHFKYPGFRRPGDVHVHFFGTATLSCADGISTQPGDVFEISAEPFSLPLANPVGRAAATPVTIRTL